jgi:hypothetical protein
MFDSCRGHRRLGGPVDSEAGLGVEEVEPRDVDLELERLTLSGEAMQLG